jgi:hypothetical protein
MSKFLIFAFFIIFFQGSCCYSQSPSALIPYELNGPDRKELIDYMVVEIQEKYYWKEDLINFYMLKHPIGHVNFAAKSAKADIYYFVWITGVVPQLVASEKTARIIEGSKRAEQRDLEKIMKIQKKGKYRIDSLFSIYKTYINTAAIKAPEEIRDSLKAIYNSRLNHIYNLYSKDGSDNAFEATANNDIYGNIEESISDYNERKLNKLKEEQIEKIDQVHSYVKSINDKIWIQVVTGNISKEKLLETLKNNSTEGFSNELIIFEKALTGGNLAFDLDLKMLGLVTANISSPGNEIELVFKSALNVEKLYKLIESNLPK